PFVPVVERRRGILDFDRFQPGVFAGRLIEMAVNTDVPWRTHWIVPVPASDFAFATELGTRSASSSTAGAELSVLILCQKQCDGEVLQDIRQQQKAFAVLLGGGMHLAGEDVAQQPVRSDAGEDERGLLPGGDTERQVRGVWR